MRQGFVKTENYARFTVTTQQPHDGRCLMLVEVVDATGTPYTFEHFVQVGG